MLLAGKYVPDADFFLETRIAGNASSAFCQRLTDGGLSRNAEAGSRLLRFHPRNWFVASWQRILNWMQGNASRILSRNACQFYNCGRKSAPFWNKPRLCRDPGVSRSAAAARLSAGNAPEIGAGRWKGRGDISAANEMLIFDRGVCRQCGRAVSQTASGRNRLGGRGITSLRCTGPVHLGRNRRHDDYLELQSRHQLEHQPGGTRACGLVGAVQ